MINKTLLDQSKNALESLDQIIKQVNAIPAKGSPWEILSWVYFQLKDTRDKFKDNLEDWEQEYKEQTDARQR